MSMYFTTVPSETLEVGKGRKAYGQYYIKENPGVFRTPGFDSCRGGRIRTYDPLLPKMKSCIYKLFIYFRLRAYFFLECALIVP